MSMLSTDLGYQYPYVMSFRPFLLLTLQLGLILRSREIRTKSMKTLNMSYHPCKTQCGAVSVRVRFPPSVTDYQTPEMMMEAADDHK